MTSVFCFASTGSFYGIFHGGSYYTWLRHLNFFPNEGQLLSAGELPRAGLGPPAPYNGYLSHKDLAEAFGAGTQQNSQVECPGIGIRLGLALLYQDLAV